MSPVKVTRVANAHIQKAAKWWLVNREKAPEAFKEELQRGFALISRRPEVGAKATNVKLKDVRRIHLSRVRYFLYYRKITLVSSYFSSRIERATAQQTEMGERPGSGGSPADYQ